MSPEILHAFSGDQLPTVAALAQIMRNGGWTPEQVLAAYAARMDQIRQQYAAARSAQTTSPSLSCPRCGSPLELQPLCPQVSPHWRTAVACTHESCAYHGLSTDSATNLLRGRDSAAIEER